MLRVLYFWGMFFLFILVQENGIAQKIKIFGVVVDENAQPLSGATVKVKNAEIGVVTDNKGFFSLHPVSVGQKLLVSYIGRKGVEAVADSNMWIMLHRISEPLDEVVVQVAYGSQKRYAVTGAVASVRSEDIEKRPVTSVVAALDGGIPGIQVNNTYGQPGDDPVIQIRGFASINGVNTPLFVVDGVPYAGNLSELNPDDVESVSVLKDAQAAALYGNRAANGVVLVTMKKAVSRRLSMEFSIRQGIYARGMKEYECVGPDDFMEVMWKSYRNSLLTTDPSAYPSVMAANEATNSDLIQSYLKYNIYNVPDDQLFDAEGHLSKEAKIREAFRGDLDWFEPLVRKGFRQEYGLNGGAVHEKSDYRFSLGYLNEEGFLTNAGFDRLTARLQLNITPRQWLKCGVALSGNHQNQKITDGTGNSFINVFNISRYVAPIYPVHLHDLRTGEYILDNNGNKQYDNGTEQERPQYPGRNIIWENELAMNKLLKTALTGQAFIELKLPWGFSFMVKGDLYLANQERKVYYSPEVGDGVGVGKTHHYQYRFKRYVVQEQLKWQRQTGRHKTEVLWGHENYDYNYLYTALSKTDQILPGNTSLSNFTTMKNLLGYPKDYRTESYLGTVRYNYDNRYFAEVAFRRDGSSRFQANSRWGNFGSCGLGWLLSREQFLVNSRWVDFLKLRFSYGQVGNDAGIDYYGWMSLYKIAIHSGKGSLYKSQIADERIKWETVTTYDAALEATLFGRWNFVIEYFDKRSDDLLFNVSLPLSVGATSTDASGMAAITRNMGSVSNRGWELSTDVDVIQSSVWGWNIGISATRMRNKILTLPPENRNSGILIAGQNQKYMEGHSIYEWWLPCYAGVDRLTGNSLYVADPEYDKTGAGEKDKRTLSGSEFVKIGDSYYTTNVSFARKDWCGSALPEIYGNFSSRLRWKAVSFSALFTYSIGGKIYDQSYASLMETGSTPRAVHRDILKSWEAAPENMREDSPGRLNPEGIPVVNSALNVKNNAASSRFLIDGSFLWIKNITLAYTLPECIIEKLDLAAIHIRLSIENLSLFTKRQGMNPMQSFTGLSEDVLVAPKVFSLGLTVKL